MIIRYGLGDVHVEMKEGGYIPLVADAGIRQSLFAPIPPIGTSMGITYEDGTPIKFTSGTMGLYLKLGGETGLYGLTCRHVVFPQSRPPPGMHIPLSFH